MDNPGRNDPCPCGSGKKFKKCCANKSYLQRKTAKVISASDNPLAQKISTLSPNQKVASLFSQAVTPKPSSQSSLKGKITKGKVE